MEELREKLDALGAPENNSELESTKVSKYEMLNVEESSVDGGENDTLKERNERAEEEQIEILETTIAGLSSANDEQHARLTEIEENYKCQLAALSEELEIERNKTSEMGSKISQFESNIEHLEAHVLVEGQKPKYVKENMNFCDDNEALKLNEEMRLLQDRSEQLNENISELEDRNSELNEQVSLWQDKYITTEREKKKQDQELMEMFALITKSNSGTENNEDSYNNIDDVSNQVKQYILKQQTQIDDLVLNVKQRDNEIESLHEASRSLLEKLEVKENELRNKDELYGKQEMDIVNSKTVLESLSAKLMEKAEECHQLTSKLENEKCALRNLEERCKTLEQSLEEKKVTLASVTETAFAEKERLTSLQEAVNRAEVEGHGKENLSQELKETISKQEKDIEQLTEEITNLRKDVQVKEQDLSGQKQISNNELQKLLEKLNRQESDCVKLGERIEVQNNELTTLNTTIQTKEKEFNDHIEMTKNETKELSEMVNSEKSECRKLEDMVKMKDEKLKILDEKIVEYKQEVIQKDRQLTELQVIKEKMEMEFSNMKEKETFVEDDVIKKEQELQTFAANEGELLEKVKSFEEILKEKDEVLGELNQDVERHSNEKFDLQKEVNVLREHANTYEDSAKMHQETIERHCKEVEESRVSKGKG